jgi:hypothetical protein
MTSDFKELAALLKRCTDTKPEFFRKLFCDAKKSEEISPLGVGRLEIARPGLGSKGCSPRGWSLRIQKGETNAAHLNLLPPDGPKGVQSTGPTSVEEGK